MVFLRERKNVGIACARPGSIDGTGNIVAVGFERMLQRTMTDAFIQQ